MTAYRDEDGNVLLAEEVIFQDDSDDEYVKNNWYRSPEKVYLEILKENTYIYNDYIKGKF